MKTISGALLSHLSGALTTIATCVKVTRADGQVYAWTDHDEDLVVDSVTYAAAQGYDASDVQTDAGLNVDNLDISGYLDAAAITEASIVAGLWDRADVRIFIVNWADLSQGTMKLRRGWLGEVSITRSFVAELRGMAQKLQQSIGEIISERCKAAVFDSRCKLVPTAGVWLFDGTVTSVTVQQKQWTDSGLVQADGFFTAGLVTWVTGDNAGLEFEIKQHSAAAGVVLHAATPYAIQAGDTYTIRAGCLKRFTEDCVTKFSNGVNFRGSPFTPGGDVITRGPQ